VNNWYHLVEKRAIEIAEEINENAPISVHKAKAVLNFGRNVALFNYNPT
jgi:hypothetical protein